MRCSIPPPRHPELQINIQITTVTVPAKPVPNRPLGTQASTPQPSNGKHPSGGGAASTSSRNVTSQNDCPFPADRLLLMHGKELEIWYTRQRPQDIIGCIKIKSKIEILGMYTVTQVKGTDTAVSNGSLWWKTQVTKLLWSSEASPWLPASYLQV